MLEDQVASLLQKYLGDYVIGLNKEALKISVWQGDVELTNMQLRPEALNALKLPVKVKAGFLGSVKLKVPWSRLGQDPVLVYLDRIFLLAEPETHVESCSEHALQEAKNTKIREMEMKLLESAQQIKPEVNKSWLASLIDTIIGNLKLSISNIHIRYEDLESNSSHPFAAGVTLEKLTAVTVDDNGREAFVTGGGLDHIHKFVELERLALYFDSDITPWRVSKPWEDLLPLEWDRVFMYGIEKDRRDDYVGAAHTYILEPVSGNAEYSKLRHNGPANSGQPLQKAVVNLDDVTLSLSKDAYRDMLKLADNFAGFNQRLRYAHYRPLVSVKYDPRSWWTYACKAVTDQIKAASGKLSWEHVLRYASLRKRYISLYASLLRADNSRSIIDGNEDLEELDRELDIDVILQWRMLAHKFVEQSIESAVQLRQQTQIKSWWPFGWNGNSIDEEPLRFSEEDWERINNMIGYKEGHDDALLTSKVIDDVLLTSLEIHMQHNASKLLVDPHECLAELSCEILDCSISLYSEAKVFDIKLGSYRLSSPSGLLAESASTYDSLAVVFSYKPFNTKLDWSLVAKASPCYMTYLKDTIDQIIHFFEKNTVVSQTIALETAAAVQMTINEVKRTAQQQVNRALKDQSRFLLDLDIAAPKITIPSGCCPDYIHSSKLLLDLGNLVIRTKDDYDQDSQKVMEMYLQFNLVLSDVSAFLIDGDYHWDQGPLGSSATCFGFWPVIEKCGIAVKFQQIQQDNPSYPATRIAVRLPCLGFHFSPARFHRLIQVAKIFQKADENSDVLRPWNQADFGGWLPILVWKGVANREAVWQHRYLCLVGTSLYVLESPNSKSYEQCISLHGKHVYKVPREFVGGIEHVLAVCDVILSGSKVVEDVNVVKLRCDSDDLRRTWQSRLRAAVYRVSGSAPITSLSRSSSDNETSEGELVYRSEKRSPLELENMFVTGILDELKILFSYSNEDLGQNIEKVLNAEESQLFEFRAKGGQVELSVRSNDMFIVTVLKSLEIEDLVSSKEPSQRCYLARSFIRSMDATSFSDDAAKQSLHDSDLAQNDVVEEFYEAPESLVESIDTTVESSESIPQPLGSRKTHSSEKSSLKPPSFTRVHLFQDDPQPSGDDIETMENLDSFVKAQIFIYDQNSPRYDRIDKRVVVTLATLSFIFRRPTILAILKFINAINVSEESSGSDNISGSFSSRTSSVNIREDANYGIQSTVSEETVVKGLLGKGKSRIVFYLTLNMARAQISLMKEDDTKISTLSLNLARADIKVYPSSFSIQAALGNLKISDDSLSRSHLYYWICDMRDPEGSSFVELIFDSFGADDDDFIGYEYSLTGQLSELRVIYLNRFVQEIVCYFTGLLPKSSNGIVKLNDQVTNSEKWFTAREIEGSPAMKLDISLRKPIILMPHKTDSIEYLKLDVVHITVQNTFEWIRGGKDNMNGVHVETMTILINDINLCVGTGTKLGDSIIQDVKGVSVVVRRSLRDLLHQIPSTEATVKVVELRAALSNKEYQIITDCALSNISETPNLVAPLDLDAPSSSADMVNPIVHNALGSDSEVQDCRAWTALEVFVVIDLVELCLRTGIARDVSLATLQVTGAWLLYKSNTRGEGYLSATLQGFEVIDGREGTEPQYRLAVGKPETIGHRQLCSPRYDDNRSNVDTILPEEEGIQWIPSMLILDARISQLLTSVSISVQRPQLLVALDFLLAVIEFFVPSVSSILLDKEDNNSCSLDAIILDQPTFNQPSSEFSLSPEKCLVVDDERFDQFIYDGKGGQLLLQDREALSLSGPSMEPIIFVGNGKSLQFKNVIIKSGQYLDSCILLGANSSYSVSEEDQVLLEQGGNSNHSNPSMSNVDSIPVQASAAELVIEIQAIGPELTFYNTSKNVTKSPSLSNKILHAQLDVFCRLNLKGETSEMSANAYGLTLESSGIRVLEPVDACVKFSNASGKTNIHLDLSDVFFNFSFSTLKLFLALEEDLLSFLRMTSKKMTVVCSEFDKVGTISSQDNDLIYAFWRPHAPPGFAVLGDYLTPLDKPPTKGVLAVNTGFVRVKKPMSFRKIWPPVAPSDISNSDEIGEGSCSIWFPEAPEGFVALGCVVSAGREAPELSSVHCISTSLVSPGSLRDCIASNDGNIFPSKFAFWRVDNSVGTFLPADPTTLHITGKAYDLRHIFFRKPETFAQASNYPAARPALEGTIASERSAVNSGRRFEAIASFKLIWWNQGSKSRKQFSVWRPVVPQGMIFFGDIAVQGYEPPNSCIVLHSNGNEDYFRGPLDFQLVGQIKKQRGTEGISFWLPVAPLGFVSLGCIACLGMPKKCDLISLGCMRSDMVSGDLFLEESLWDTSDAKNTTEPFSIWAVANELGTFLVRSGFKRPPKRFALKLADSNMPTGSDDIVIDAEIRTFSAAVFDDYGGLMVPLFNLSVNDVGFSLHGRSDFLNSTASFSLAARSYNDKFDAWEPLIEPVDGFVRYQYDRCAPGAVSQLRLTSTRDLLLNVSVSNANMIFQAYASWINLGQVYESYRKQEAVSFIYGGGSTTDIHHKQENFVIPQNKLGQDIFVRVAETKGLSNVIRMPSGDMKPVRVPVSKNMLDSHMKGMLCRKLRILVAVIIADAEFPRVVAVSSPNFTAAVRLTSSQSLPCGFISHRQSTRTCGRGSEYSYPGIERVKWNEVFFFKAETLDCYTIELAVTDTGNGEPIGYFATPLKGIARNIEDILRSDNHLKELAWIDLSKAKPMRTENDHSENSCGRIRCAIVFSPTEAEPNKKTFLNGNNSGVLQISPTSEGPWTTMKLNYAAPAACWRFGNGVIASNVTVKGGTRYVNIRSLVSVRNNTDFSIDLCLKASASNQSRSSANDADDHGGLQMNYNLVEVEEFFETESFYPTVGWVGCSTKQGQTPAEAGTSSQVRFGIQLPSGWEWANDWNLDNQPVNTADGWVYAPNLESLNWPESHNPLKFVNYARQRRWVRTRKRISDDFTKQISVGQLKPGGTIHLPHTSLMRPYNLQLKPSSLNNENGYSWGSVVNSQCHIDDSSESDDNFEICVSNLTASEKLLHCTLLTGSSDLSLGMWFCLSIQATELAKDIHSSPVQDWTLVVKPPLCITNFLPMAAEYSVFEKKPKSNFAACSRGILFPGKTVRVHDADVRNPIYFSLFPQRGWLPIQEAILISHPDRVPSKTISLRSSISGRETQIIIEQNHDTARLGLQKIIRVYAPCWFSVSRCPPLSCRLFDLECRKGTQARSFSCLPHKDNELIYTEVTDEEIYEGYTIASPLNFKYLGISVSINHTEKGQFGPMRELSPLSEMDGSLELSAYDADGNCMRLFVSSKPCTYQSVPTKVISIRPFVTFTNRVGHDLFIKLSSEDEAKVLHAFDSRVPFVYRETAGSDKIQVREEDTEWSFPVQIIKEDTVFLVLRKCDGTRKFLRTEVRGYEEGSRFIVVFRVGSVSGPIRIENRIFSQTISIRQSGFGNDCWIHLPPLSTTNFAWDDPYGRKLIDAEVNSGTSIIVQKFDLEKTGLHCPDDGVTGMQFHVTEVGDTKVVTFTEDKTFGLDSRESIWFLTPTGNWDISRITNTDQSDTSPLEIIVEVGVVGVSVIDYRPKELCYLYLERVFISYLNGCDGGNTSRFKLILGCFQLDNQLPLTIMPVLLVPEKDTNMNHPVVKLTVTTQNNNSDGVLVFPYIYIRVTETLWRLNIHEPIIWALVNFYGNLQLDRFPKSSSVTQVDPEIRIDLIDVSEVRLKVSLETAPTQRPIGVLGLWSPILSAVGNAFKIQLHLRKVMRRDRFMRKSSLGRAIGNRIWRDLIHNPLHLIFSLDVLGITSSTLASLSRGFAELSTDGQFLQLRSKQVRSRRILGVRDGILQGTEALAQGVAFGVSGVLTKPMESARENGLLGLAHGLGRACLGFVVQPVSGALDFFSLAVDGLGASCSRCLEVFDRTSFQRIRNPRAIRADSILMEYSESEAVGQMILYLAEARRRFGCTEIFKEPSKYAWSDYYEDHYIIPSQKIVLITNKRVMLLQSLSLEQLDKKPCKIIWDLSWDELMALELAKAGSQRASYLILHLKNFRRSENFARVIKCHEDITDEREPQAVQICSVVHKMWKAYQSHVNCVSLRVPSSQGSVSFARSQDIGGSSFTRKTSSINSRELFLSNSPASEPKRFLKHSVNFQKIWSSDRLVKSRLTLFQKQVPEGTTICSIWRPICPDGYVCVGDIARFGSHPPNVAAVYRNTDQLFSLPVGYDLVWRNCQDDYTCPVSIWLPRPPAGFASLGCVAVSGFAEPAPDSVYCVAESLAEDSTLEEQRVWSAPDAYPWACYIYQVRSAALHFVVLRQPREDAEWKPMRVADDVQPFGTH